MRLFTVPTVETRRRTYTVAAPDAASATAAIRAQLPKGARVLATAIERDHDAETALGEDALAYLLGQDYLPDENRDMKIEDWVLRAAATDTPAERARVNALLAPVGLRVDDRTLWVGSAQSVPAMGLIFAGTQWAGAALGAALRRIPGAELSNMCFAGKRARAIGLPLAAIFAAGRADALASDT